VCVIVVADPVVCVVTAAFEAVVSSELVQRDQGEGIGSCWSFQGNVPVVVD
jgi:hypothetical protein